MKAVDFITKIKDNQILIPEETQLKLVQDLGKEVRVIVLVEDIENQVFQKSAKDQFLEGYADSDAIYDQP